VRPSSAPSLSGRHHGLSRGDGLFAGELLRIEGVLECGECRQRVGVCGESPPPTINAPSLEPLAARSAVKDDVNRPRTDPKGELGVTASAILALPAGDVCDTPEGVVPGDEPRCDAAGEMYAEGTRDVA